MADGYLIGAEYLFKSNAQRELGLIAKYSAQAAEGIEALQKSTSALSASLETMIRFVGGARSSLDAMLPTIDRLAVAFGRLDTMVESIGPTAAASGAEADTAFTGVVARLEAVTVAARTAAGSLRMVGRAGVTGAAGSTVQGGVGAGFASGAAMRFAGNAAGVGGLAALATLAIGTKQRANLQDSMIQTGLAMGRSDQWVQANLLPTAMRMSMNTAQSVGDSMGLIRTMATSGINDPRDIQALSMPMARYADTQYLGKNHVPFDQSIASIAGVAHQLNLRTAGQLVPFLNTAYKISNDMPDSMKKAFTQIGYFGPGYAGSGVSPQEILKLQANADRLGYGSGKSGTGLNMLYRNLVNPTAAQYRAQRSLGLLDAKGRPRAFDAQGNFDPESLFGQVNAAQHRQFALGRDGKMAFGANLGAAFSANTGRIVGSFSSDSGLAQMRNVNATLARVPDLETAQVQLMSSLNSQTKLLVTNFATLTAILGGPLVAPLTSFVKKLSDATGGAATYLSTHPRESNLATGALTVAAGGGAVYGLKKLGGLRIFGHIAEHEAKHSLGLGASVGIRRGAHAGEHLSVFEDVGKMFQHAGDHFANRPIGKFVGTGVDKGLSVFGKFGEVFERIVSGPAGKVLTFVAELAERWLPKVALGLIGIGSGAAEAIGAIMLLAEGIKFVFGGGGANLVKQVRIWWENNKAGIGYEIGYAFGTISKWLTAAIQGLMSAAGTALAYVQSHWKDLLFDRPEFSKGLDAQLAAAAKANGGSSLLDYINAGKAAAAAGGPNDPHSVTYDLRNPRNRGAVTSLRTIPVGSNSRGPTTVNLNLPKGTPQQHAEQTIDILDRFWNGSSNAAASGSGSNRGSATGPRLGSSILVPSH